MVGGGESTLRSSAPGQSHADVLYLVCTLLYFIVFKDFICLFLERWEGREKERERNIGLQPRHVP